MNKKRNDRRLATWILIGAFLVSRFIIAQADISNPHPTPPSNSVTNAMLTSTAVQDNVVATNAAINATKIATDTTHEWLTENAQSLGGVKTFKFLPVLPTDTPSSTNQAISLSYFNTNAITTASSSPAPIMASTSSASFSFTGAVASTSPPAGATWVTITAEVAAGGSANIGGAVTGGAGGKAIGSYPVTSSTILYYSIGGQGQIAGGVGSGVNPGGFGGGGAGDNRSAAGGGMTWVSTTSTFNSSVIIVAAGGGGAGQTAAPGAGGGLAGGDAGDNGTCLGGKGGSQTAGGAAGTASGGVNGSAGSSGAGGAGAVDTSDGGGGGGGGYYGGGGGSEKNGVCAGSAGGGSSFLSTSLFNATTTSGTQTATGTLSFVWYVPEPNGSITGNNYGGKVSFNTTHTTGTIAFGSGFPNQEGCTLTLGANINVWIVSLTQFALSFNSASAISTSTNLYYTCI